MKILIVGDSFSAKWPDTERSWVDLLSKEHDVTNVSQAGVSEYKVYKQIPLDLSSFDCIIVSHTSPSRIHVKEHPLHKSGLHKNCDLIFNDIDRFAFFNRKLKTAKNWFRYFYDDEYQIDIYNLLREKINTIINIPYISLSHIELVNELSVEENHLDFSELWLTERGVVNHYTEKGNQIVFNTIQERLKTCKE